MIALLVVAIVAACFWLGHILRSDRPGIDELVDVGGTLLARATPAGAGHLMFPCPICAHDEWVPISAVRLSADERRCLADCWHCSALVAIDVDPKLLPELRRECQHLITSADIRKGLGVQS